VSERRNGGCEEENSQSRLRRRLIGADGSKEEELRKTDCRFSSIIQAVQGGLATGCGASLSIKLISNQFTTATTAYDLLTGGTAGEPAGPGSEADAQNHHPRAT